jgi:adenylosuccinate lyase
MAAGKAHALLASLLEGIEVCTERMRANLEASGGFALSERAMLALAPHIGKETARRVIQRVAASARRESRSFAAAFAGDRDICAYLTKEELGWLTAFDAQVGHCQALVDRVLSTQCGGPNSEFVG